MINSYENILQIQVRFHLPLSIAQAFHFAIQRVFQGLDGHFYDWRLRDKDKTRRTRLCKVASWKIDDKEILRFN